MWVKLSDRPATTYGKTAAVSLPATGKDLAQAALAALFPAIDASELAIKLHRVPSMPPAFCVPTRDEEELALRFDEFRPESRVEGGLAGSFFLATVVRRECRDVNGVRLVVDWDSAE